MAFAACCGWADCQGMHAESTDGFYAISKYAPDNILGAVHLKADGVGSKDVLRVNGMLWLSLAGVPEILVKVRKLSAGHACWLQEHPA